ncbi:MAG: TIGR00289 family protein [Methanobrevibacter thaueri]|jgi:predicted ATP pyrophosphatase (TIGR00289 family)|uniref:TIGR00289 family protein n=1 Tax=Methanobrevibacter thaueri TaxID=190975 RepID=A0A8T3V8F1_9EURY|nr:TIGR00289 family protein [Methanobrevibacter thaueri]MBE6502561.1 TIGR00289 family protein [Methanobrevibacter thaueri]
MNVAVLFSGGKDSTMAVYAALEAKEDVKYLLSMKSKNDESYMFHVPNIHVTDLLAEALDIPIMSVETDGVKEEELEDLKVAFKDLKNLGIEAIYTGALYSVYQKSRIEKLGDEVGLEIISPYWHVDELEYMRKIVSLGFKIMICGVAAWGLDESWLGRVIDDETVDELVKLNEKYRLDIAFEGGEAETLAIDGPIFKKRLKIIKYKKEWHLDSGVYIIEDAILEDK